MPVSCQGCSLEEAIAYCAELGLEAFELEFVYGVFLKENEAIKLKILANKLGIQLSSHAPYYINLCSIEKAKIEVSKQRLFKSVMITHLFGGRLTVFHPGFYQGQTREQAMKKVKKALEDVRELMLQHNISCLLGIETVGKKAAFGGLEENIAICRDLEQVFLVLDFAHIHARGDCVLKSKEDYYHLFSLLEKELGTKYVKNFHAHFSEIEYGPRGERRHLVLGTNNTPPIQPLLEVIYENGYGGTIICETPKLELDSIKMKKMWEILKSGRRS